MPCMVEDVAFRSTAQHPCKYALNPHVSVDQAITSLLAGVRPPRNRDDLQAGS